MKPKIPRLVMVSLLIVVVFLFGSSFSRGDLLIRQAYAATNTGTGVACITGANGIAANGKIGVPQCGPNVTLKLRSGAVINSTRGFGLRSNTTSLGSGDAALYGQQGGGSGIEALWPSGVWGDANSGVGVVGLSNSNHGIWGETADSRSSGVYGFGLFGGDGVTGQSDTGFAIVAKGTAQQSIDSGGWVKGLVVSRFDSLANCFNSQTGIRAVAESCAGFSLSGSGGDYKVAFPFVVNNRYIVITLESVTPALAVYGFVGSTQIEVKVYNLSGNLTPSSFVVAVF